jgi:hypothetical protein
MQITKNTGRTTLRNTMPRERKMVKPFAEGGLILNIAITAINLLESATKEIFAHTVNLKLHQGQHT